MNRVTRRIKLFLVVVLLAWPAEIEGEQELEVPTCPLVISYKKICDTKSSTSPSLCI